MIDPVFMILLIMFVCGAAIYGTLIAIDKELETFDLDGFPIDKEDFIKKMKNNNKNNTQ